jgi:Transcriptional regulators containing a DNA-binding HTH domain and an aminotransferase domain (MocR family) and their eukaryotic orthologs
MWISIDKESSLTISRQLYQQMKKMIISGAFQPMEKLPSTRALAQELNISRSTILDVYSQLISEGYLEGHHGSGTVVAKCLPKPFLTPDTAVTKQIPERCREKYLIDFRSGVPDLEYFPSKEWGKLYYHICSDLPASALRYYNPAGVYELRLAISQYLYRTRGISCHPHNIMIISGATQGLSFVSKLLWQENSEVIIEDPIHQGLLNVITSNKYHIVSIPVDSQGLHTDLLKPSDHTAFLYTTPSHQYPLGGILSLPRRIALIQYALDNDSYIIEDDYDSEFRFEGQPVNSLYELNPERVIYISSFSKILAPALRLGFMLLPDHFLTSYREIKQYSDVHTEAISQYVLANFIQDGGLERHIWKMKKLYDKKRRHLIEELEAYFSGEYNIMGQAAGLHLVVCFHKIRFTEELVKKIYSGHIKIYPVAEYSICHRAEHENEIILGYAHLALDEITEGIKILSKILHEFSLYKAENSND